jgi:hypothetical protein
MQSALTLSFSNGRSEMADRELIAAILTTGILPTWKFLKAAHGPNRSGHRR